MLSAVSSRERWPYMKSGEAVSDYRLLGQGRREVRFKVPDGWQVKKYAELKAERLDLSVPDLVRAALAAPLGTRRWRNW
jgi:hypothetical protein